MDYDLMPRLDFLALILLSILCVAVGCLDMEGSNEDLTQPLEGLDFLTEGTVSDSFQLNIKSNSKDPSEYDAVTNANLFHPDRIFEVDESEEEPTPTPDPKKTTVDIPGLKLVGTMIMGENSFAYIIDSNDKDSKGKTKQFKKGDKIGDYTITDVGADRIELNNGTVKAQLKLKPGEGKRRGKRGKRGKAYNRKGGRRSQDRRGSAASGKNDSGMSNKEKRKKEAMEKARERAREKSRQRAMEKERMEKEGRSGVMKPGKRNNRRSRSGRRRNTYNPCGGG